MKRFLVITAVVIGLSAVDAMAQDGASTTMTVSASVVPNCRIEIQPMNFGLYDPLVSHGSAPLQAQAELSLLCTRDVPANIELDAGSFGTDTRSRALGLGTDRLSYGLFIDAARSQIWGVGSDALFLNGSERASAEPFRLTVYGTIPPAQEVVAGDYTDIVTARVNF